MHGYPTVVMGGLESRDIVDKMAFKGSDRMRAGCAGTLSHSSRQAWTSPSLLDLLPRRQDHKAVNPRQQFFEARREPEKLSCSGRHRLVSSAHTYVIISRCILLGLSRL